MWNGDPAVDLHGNCKLSWRLCTGKYESGQVKCSRFFPGSHRVNVDASEEINNNSNSPGPVECCGVITYVSQDYSQLCWEWW